MTSSSTEGSARPDLEQIMARCEAATEGPWSHRMWDEPSRTVEHPAGFICTTNHDNDLANAAFIAAARTDLPAVVAWATHLESEVARLASALRAAEEELAWYQSKPSIYNAYRLAQGLPTKCAECDKGNEAYEGLDGVMYHDVWSGVRSITSVPCRSTPGAAHG